MIRQHLMIALALSATALSAAGCISTVREPVAGCAALSITDAESVFVRPAAGQVGTSTLLDARLVSGRVTQTPSNCLIEGVAPTRKVAEAQARWVVARARARCGGVSERIALQPSKAPDSPGYAFAVRVTPDREPASCQAATNSGSDTPASVDVSSRMMNPPSYPGAAMRQGLEGRVVLLVQVNAVGGTDALLVTGSSGHPVLDDAALAAAERWRFNPGLNSAGEAIGGLVRVPVEFSLGN